MLVAVWSPKGGAGTSLLAAALALQMQELGRPTILVDLDPQKADQATLLQCPIRPSVLDWPVTAGPAGALPDQGFVFLDSGLRVMPGPARLVEEGGVGRELAESLLGALAAWRGMVVLDLAATLRDSTVAAMDRADVLLLVITPDLLSLRAAYALLQESHLLGLKPDRVRLVVNRSGSRGGLAPADITDMLELPVAAYLPSAPELAAAVNQGRAVRWLLGRNPYTRAVAGLAGELVPAAVRRGGSRKAAARAGGWLSRLVSRGPKASAGHGEREAPAKPGQAPAPGVSEGRPPAAVIRHRPRAREAGGGKG